MHGAGRVKKLNHLTTIYHQGVDELNPKILNEFSEDFPLPLLIIFGKSFKEGKLPQKWKDTIITPLHKNGACKLV